MSGVFISCQGCCESCDALTLFAVCQRSLPLPPPPQRIETKERGRRGRGAQPISDNTHSVSPSHTSTSTELDYLAYICSHASRNMKTKKKKERNSKKMPFATFFFLHNQADIFLGRTSYKSLKSRPAAKPSGNINTNTPKMAVL